MPRESGRPSGFGRLTRRLRAGAFAAALLTPYVAEAGACARPADLNAFNVAALKSRLMVTALTCNAREKYNDFVTRYRTDLVRQEKALDGYFGRAYGRNARQQHDQYTTLLANSESEIGEQQGTLFCAHNVGLFDQALALHDGAALPGFAAAQAIPQPTTLTPCPVAPPRKTAAKTVKKASATP